MSDEQKIQLLKRQAPLLFPLIEEFKIYNTELKNTLEPLSKLLRDAGKINCYRGYGSKVQEGSAYKVQEGVIYKVQ